MADAAGRFGPWAYGRALVRLLVAPIYVPYALWRRRRLQARLARDERRWRDAMAAGVCATCGRAVPPAPPGPLGPEIPPAVREYRLWLVSGECGPCREARLALEVTPSAAAP